MKEKIKGFFKSRIFICILTALVTGTVSVYAVTYFPSNQVIYDNKTSGLKSADFQGAIDELYSTCSKSIQSGNHTYFVMTSVAPDGYTSYSSTFRINLDGSNEQNIYSTYGSIDYFYVTKDYIYFILGSGNFYSQSSIYQISINGGVEKEIYSAQGSIDSIFVTEEYIYFSDSYGSNSIPNLMRLSINGGNAEKIYSDDYGASIKNIFIK